MLFINYNNMVFFWFPNIYFTELYEDPDNLGLNEEAWRKAKDMYASCMDTGKYYTKHGIK